MKKFSQINAESNFVDNKNKTIRSTWIKGFIFEIKKCENVSKCISASSAGSLQFVLLGRSSCKMTLWKHSWYHFTTQPRLLTTLQQNPYEKSEKRRKCWKPAFSPFSSHIFLPFPQQISVLLVTSTSSSTKCFQYLGHSTWNRDWSTKLIYVECLRNGKVTSYEEFLILTQSFDYHNLLNIQK